jgi:hypothetical protein
MKKTISVGFLFFINIISCKVDELLYQDLITVLVANGKEITLEAYHTERNQKILSENNTNKYRIIMGVVFCRIYFTHYRM